MRDVKGVSSWHNRRVLRAAEAIHPAEKKTNYRVQNECPLYGKCLTASILYNAEISTADTYKIRNYIGVTAGPFKKRFSDHKKPL